MSLLKGKNALIWCAILAGLVLLICTVLYLINPMVFWQDDYQSYFLPGFVDIGRALEAGEFPLLSPWSWFGGDLVGEYQYGLFNWFEMLSYFFVYKLHCSLPLSAALLSSIHLLVMAIGVFFLARLRGLSSPISSFAAIIFTFSGWGFCWGACNWYIALSGTMWLPWLWWSLDWALQGERSIRKILLPAVFVYLIITAGFPYGILMGAAVSVWKLVERIRAKDGKYCFAVFSVVWIFGIGLSAPAWMSLIEYSKFTVRNLDPQELGKWAVPFNAVGGMITPHFPSVWRVYSGCFISRTSIELFNGVLPIILIISAICLGKLNFYKKHKSLMLFAIIVFLLASLPGIGGFRFSFKWLVLFHLIIALLGAESLADLLATDKGREYFKKRLSVYVLLSIMVMFGLARYCNYSNIGYDSFNEGHLIGFLAIFGLYGLLIKRINEKHIALVSFLAVASVFVVAYGNLNMYGTYPQWNFADSLLNREPMKKNLRYMSFYMANDIYPVSGRFEKKFGDFLKPANLSMLSGVQSVQGYSPQGHYGLAHLFYFKWFGQINEERKTEKLIQRESGPRGLLALMGVDGIVLSRSYSNMIEPLRRNGWKKVGASNDKYTYDFAVVMERMDKPSPRVRSVGEVIIRNNADEIVRQLQEHRSEQAPIIIWDKSQKAKESRAKYSLAKTRLIKDERNYSILSVDNKSGKNNALILVSRAWYPGFKAEMNHHSLSVENANLIMPAILIPPGESGEVRLYFFPDSLRIGLALAVAALLAGVFATIFDRLLTSLFLLRVGCRGEQ